MTKFKELKEKLKNKIMVNKKKVEAFALTFLLVSAPTISAHADINGNTIKNNMLNNFIGPILFVLVGIALLKEITKKNTAGIIMSIIVGGLVWIFIYQPNALTVVGNTIKGILGL